MDRDPESIGKHQLQKIQEIAEQYDVGTCVQCALTIKAYLKYQNLPGRFIRLETLSPHGLQGIICDDASNQQIATNGFHEAIAIKVAGVTTVFDNLYPQGKPLEDWLKDFVVIPGNQLNIVRNEPF